MEEKKVVRTDEIETPTATAAPNQETFIDKMRKKVKKGGKRVGSGRPSGDVAVALNSTMSIMGGNSREVLKYQKKAAFQNITLLEKKLMQIIKSAQNCISMDKITARDIQSLYIALGIAQTKKSELEVGIKEDDSQGIQDNEDLDGKQKEIVADIMRLMKKASKPSVIVVNQGDSTNTQ